MSEHKAEQRKSEQRKAAAGKADRPKVEQQYGALPFRRRDKAGVEVMLITSRDTGRWVIPKGWPVRGLSPADSAAREAREEGGLVGRLDAESVGRYHYDKRLSGGVTVLCNVDVFAMEVERQLKTWPERSQRRTQWFAASEAAAAVQEPELRSIILTLAERLR